MDALQAFEAAAKSAKSAAITGVSYLGAVRQAYRDALGPSGDPMDYYASRLGRLEEGGETLEPQSARVSEPPLDMGASCSGCGRWFIHRDDCAVVSRSAAADVVPTPNPPRCARCDTKLGEVAAKSDLTPGMFCSDRCRKAAEILQVLREHPTSPSSTAAPAPQPREDGEGPNGESDIPPSPPLGQPTQGEYAAVAVREVLAAHVPSVDSEGVYCDGLDGIIHAQFDDWFDWREHVAAEVSRRINAAAADARVAERLAAVPEKFTRWFQK
jgi:hypothetical protein